MGLLDDLRASAGHLDSSLQPSSNEVAPLLGALIAYQEHGDKFLKAESGEDVSKLLSEAPAGEGASKAADADKDAGDKDKGKGGK